MRGIVVVVLLSGCGTASQQQIAETPSASAPARHAEAPPASTSDKDRERLIQGFDDMDTTQRAYREAGAVQKPPPKKTGPAEQATLPKKKGPAEQATLPPKKPGPAEQAPVVEQPAAAAQAPNK
jgi:hypothetical protein